MTGQELAAARWQDAEYAAAVLAAAAPRLGGVLVRAAPGPVRDSWLEQLHDWLPESTPWRKIPSHISETRLLGGLDLTATLQSGKPVAQRGLLAECDGGIALLAMAERSRRSVDAHLATVLDRGSITVAREGVSGEVVTSFGLVALDEGVDEDEHVSTALQERLAVHLDLHTVSIRDLEPSGLTPVRIDAARRCHHRVDCPSRESEALCAAAFALGIDGVRAPLQAMTVARVCAALDDRNVVNGEDIQRAVRLVLAPRATRVPQTEDADVPPEPAESEQPGRETESPEAAGEVEQQALEDRLIEAALASIPPQLLAKLVNNGALQRGRQSAGKSGLQQQSFTRGRPMGVMPGDPRRGARLNLVATLRAAAPWQRLRREAGGGEPGHAAKLLITRDDFRVVRYRERSQSTTIFLVDASGSAALNRLAEAKGAVELLLAECYIRRDQVALIAFRGEQAEVLLPPTRSLVRAKRNLAALPGGGGTPLASALEAASLMAASLRRRGGAPAAVLLTDGRANIARDGSRGRQAAQPDLEAAAALFRHSGLGGVLIDTSPRPHAQAETLAAALGVHYFPMPHADASELSAAVRSVTSP